VVQKDRLNFDEACKELQVSEDELEQLVANGEIASIKDGDTFYFKRDVISQFKKNRKTEPTIILADEDMELLDVMEEIDLEPREKATGKPASGGPRATEVLPMSGSAGERKGAEEEISLELPGSEAPLHEPETEPVALPAAGEAPDDTVLNLDGLLEDDGSEGTTPIPGTEISARIDEVSDITVEGSVSDETLLDTDLLEIGEEEDSFKLDTTADETLTEPTEATLLRGGGARAMQMKRKRSHAGLTVVLALTAVVLLVPLGISLNTLYVTAIGTDTVLTGPKGGPQVYKWVLDCSDMAGKWWVEWIADLFA